MDFGKLVIALPRKSNLHPCKARIEVKEPYRWMNCDAALQGQPSWRGLWKTLDHLAL